MMPGVNYRISVLELLKTRGHEKRWKVTKMEQPTELKKRLKKVYVKAMKDRKREKRAFEIFVLGKW